MPRVILSSHALRDLQRCYRFLAEKSPEAAKRATQAIRKGQAVLEQQPHLGRPVDNMPEYIREWLIDFGGSGYVARYGHDGSGPVVVLAIWHQKEAGF